MTTYHDLLARINGEIGLGETNVASADLSFLYALRAVVELHKPMTGGNYRSDKPQCSYCSSLCHSYSGLNCEDEGDGLWPCATILRIEKELK